VESVVPPQAHLRRKRLACAGAKVGVGGVPVSACAGL
jgi:hypothetical protein